MVLDKNAEFFISKTDFVVDLMRICMKDIFSVNSTCQVGLVVKNLPANIGDIRGVG